MQLIEVPVMLRAGDGRGGTRGSVAFAQPGFGRRLVRSGVQFLAGLAIGGLLLPVPLIHLFGIMFFLAMSGLALKRLVTRRVLKHAAGQCPSCQTEQDFFVGMGGRRLKFPVVSSCPACHVRLDMFPVASGAL